MKKENIKKKNQKKKNMLFKKCLMKQSVLYRVNHFKIIGTMRTVLDVSAKSFHASTLIVFYVHYFPCLYMLFHISPFALPRSLFFLM